MSVTHHDAENDFQRARRRQLMSSIASHFRSDADERAQPLSFDEVIAALQMRGQRQLGTLVIPLDRVVGSVNRVDEFDRGFRPTTARTQSRWERLAMAMRRGDRIPPIDVFKVGDLYFVQDGHHRVSVAKTLGWDIIEADVTEVRTALSSAGVTGRADLDRKHWRRIFLARVPLTGQARAEFDVTDPASYHRLAEMVEAWGARLMHAERTYLDKQTVAARWHAEEYLPVLAMIDEVGLRRPAEKDADAYLRVACERYELTREHTWDVEILESLRPRRRRRP